MKEELTQQATILWTRTKTEATPVLVAALGLGKELLARAANVLGAAAKQVDALSVKLASVAPATDTTPAAE